MEYSLSISKGEITFFEENFYIHIHELIKYSYISWWPSNQMCLGIWRTTPLSPWWVDPFDWHCFRTLFSLSYCQNHKINFFWTFQIKYVSLAVKNNPRFVIVNYDHCNNSYCRTTYCHTVKLILSHWSTKVYMVPVGYSSM